MIKAILIINPIPLEIPVNLKNSKSNEEAILFTISPKKKSKILLIRSKNNAL